VSFERNWKRRVKKRDCTKKTLNFYEKFKRRNFAPSWDTFEPAGSNEERNKKNTSCVLLAESLCILLFKRDSGQANRE
jgi:hypothetical protein